jgi:DNA-binding HxlR family transcriptional regulator
VTRADAAPAKRSYNQYCAIAYGLDRIGERWTLLIVRELLLGPKRYKDLYSALPGIATNLLSQRLRELEANGVVQRSVLPPPAGSAVYELTETGRELETVTSAVGRWGSRFMAEEPRDSEVALPSAYMTAVRRLFRPDGGGAGDVTYEMRLGERVFGVYIRKGKCAVREERPTEPSLVITTDVGTLNAILWRRLPPADALADKRVDLRGPAEELERFVRTFNFGHRGGPLEAPA